MRAVVLVSGGMDSAVVLAHLRHEGFACTALSFDYGQRHRQELAAAARVAKALGAVEHLVQTIDMRCIGASALTADIPVPKDRSEDGTIPITYVPARNTVFLAYALALAEARECRTIGIGVNAVDYSGYPDCRGDFIAAFEAAANLGTKPSPHGPIRIVAPLVSMDKGQIVRRGVELGVDFGLTTSCYDPGADGRPCRHCDACRLRALGFAAAGVADPVVS